MTLFFPSHTIVIRRLRRTGVGYNANYSATFTAYPADIQPLDQIRTNSDGRIGVLYECFLDANIDIKEADQIVTNGQTFSVKSVNYYKGAGLLDHRHCILERKDASN